VEVAAVMAAVTANADSGRADGGTIARLVGGEVDTAIFASTNQAVRFRRGQSTLGAVEKLVSMIGSVGHGTNGHTAIARYFDRKRHDRVMLFTDDQMHDAGSVDLSHVPLIYTVDLAGYRPRSMRATGPGDSRGRYTLAGFSDATFAIMATLEAGRNADWPF